MTKEEIIKPNSPRQIVGKIKKQAESKIWSKDSKDWYVAEIDDWVEYKLATQKQDLLKKIEGSREMLADLEHQQWESWSKYIWNELSKNITPLDKLLASLNKITENWMKSWKPYSELDEKIKDADRIWADKIIDAFKQLLK